MRYTSLECLKLKRLMIPSILKNVEELEFSYTAGITTLENNFLKS